MPVAQFPGNRNWGYDGVYPFAVQGSYGGPAGLKRLVFEVTANQVAAVRAAEKCGFRRKGKSKNDPLQVVYSWDVPVP